MAFWVQTDRGAVLRRNARTAHTVNRSARVGQFNHRGKANTPEDALLAQGGLLGPQCVVIHELAQLFQAGLMRKYFQLDARDTGRRVGIVRNHIELTNQQGVHADLLRCQVHQRLSHRTGDGMTHAAVLAGGGFVLKHHVEPGAVVLVLVRATHQIDHLIAFNGAGAREHGIRTNAGEVLHVKAQNFTVTVDRDAGLDVVVAGMDVAGEALQPIGHKLDRTAQHDGQRDGRKVVGISMHLDAKGATDVLAHHANSAGGQIELASVQVLHHVRSLARVVHRQALLRRAPMRDLRARLQRHARVAPKLKINRRHNIGLGKGLIDLTHFQRAREAQVVTELRVDQGRRRLKGTLHVRGGRKLFPVHLHIRQSVLGLGSRLGHHRYHWLALPTGALQRQWVLRCRFHAGQVPQRCHPGLADLGQVFPVGHQQDAGHGARELGVHRLDLHVSHRAAPEHHMPHAWQLHVVQVLAHALSQAFNAAAGD